MQVVPSLNAGGVETVTVDVARAVAQAGGRSLVASQGGRLESELEDAGAILIRLPVASRNPITLWRNIARLEAVICREQVSLVHVRSRAPALSAIAAARRAGVPVVASYHGIYGARSPLKRWYNGVMTRGDLVIANSRFTRDHIIAEHGISPDKIVVVPEGVDTRRFDPGAVSAQRLEAVRRSWRLNEDHPQIVLLAARLTDWKGHGLMIAALAALVDKEGIALVFTGQADHPGYLRALKALARRRGVADQVYFVGDTADMPAAYALAAAVVAPSSKAESFGRSVAEACAMEASVIASNLGGPAETVIDGETGWLLPPGDVDAWASGLSEPLCGPIDYLMDIGAAARARVCRHYSLESMTEATFAVYRGLVGGQA